MVRDGGADAAQVGALEPDFAAEKVEWAAGGGGALDGGPGVVAREGVVGRWRGRGDGGWDEGGDGDGWGVSAGVFDVGVDVVGRLGIARLRDRERRWLLGIVIACFVAGLPARRVVPVVSSRNTNTRGLAAVSVQLKGALIFVLALERIFGPTSPWSSCMMNRCGGRYSIGYTRKIFYATDLAIPTRRLRPCSCLTIWVIFNRR